MKKIISILCLTFIWQNTVSYAQSEAEQMYTSRKKTLESQPIIKADIIFAGDSLTHLGETTILFEDPRISNWGISGDSSKGVLNRLSTILARQPNKFFLMIGVNDLIAGRTPKEVIKHIQANIYKIQKESPETKIYIQSLLPVNLAMLNIAIQPEKPTLNDAITSLNILIENEAKKNEVTFINLYPYFLEDVESDKGTQNLDPDFSYDGLHLSISGYEKWHSLIKEYW